MFTYLFAQAESTPVGTVASVAGLVIAAGEMFGDGITPIIAGLVVGFIIALFIKETAPRKVEKTSRKSKLQLKSEFLISNNKGALKLEYSQF